MKKLRLRQKNLTADKSRAGACRPPQKGKTVNKTRRKSLAEIAEQLECLRDELETLRDEEQEYYDNMPEGIQNSKREMNEEENQ